MVPTHFSDILISNWQSAVAKIASAEDIVAGMLTRPALDFANPRVADAAAAADPAGGPLTDQQCHSRAALDVASAIVNGTDEEVTAARAEFAKFGTKDPFWSKCIVEFVEHYTLMRHSSVPYVKWTALTDFVLPPEYFPSKATVAVMGDWGTGEPRAQALLLEMAKRKPDIVLHLGDIYYSCSSPEANSFYDNCDRAFPANAPRILTLCGNHDMYSGAAPYYALLDRLGQPASFFALRNPHWQIIAADTGYNDFNPLEGGADATWLRNGGDGDPYSELAWHKDKLANSGGRKTVFLTHHQLFTLNGSITHKGPPERKLPVNELLAGQLGPHLGDIDLWLWGHEHNQLIYGPFAGLKRGRCLGASAIPVPIEVKLTTRGEDLADAASVPTLLGDPKVSTLQPDARHEFYQLGYAMLTFDGAKLHAEYLQFDTTTGTSALMYAEDL